MSRDQPDRNSDTQDWDAMKTLTTWEEGHTIISKDLQPQQSENPPQRPRSAACLFDDCEPREALVIDDGHQRTSSKKQKNKKKKDPHDKCRRHGVAVCQPKFAFAQKMKTKVTAGIKAMCDVYKKDAKDKLLNGFWCVALGGKKTQQSLLEPVARSHSFLPHFTSLGRLSAVLSYCAGDDVSFSRWRAACLASP